MQKSLSIGILFIALTSVAQKPQQMNLDIGAPDFRSLELQTFNAVNDLRLQKKLVPLNNLVFIYKKYGNERHIWQMLDKDRLFCRLYRKSQFLARYKKSLQCWRDERLASDSYYMLKEFPQLIILSRRASAQHSDSLAKYYTTSMIHALYHPTLPKEIFSHVEKVSMLYHRNDKVLSVKARVKLALFYCAFRKFDDAKSLLAPEVDNLITPNLTLRRKNYS